MQSSSNKSNNNEITTILGNLGLVYEEGPDVEDDFHNFSALNIPRKIIQQGKCTIHFI